MCYKNCSNQLTTKCKSTLSSMQADKSQASSILPQFAYWLIGDGGNPGYDPITSLNNFGTASAISTTEIGVCTNLFSHYQPFIHSNKGSKNNSNSCSFKETKNLILGGYNFTLFFIIRYKLSLLFRSRSQHISLLRRIL